MFLSLVKLEGGNMKILHFLMIFESKGLRVLIESYDIMAFRGGSSTAKPNSCKQMRKAFSPKEIFYYCCLSDFISREYMEKTQRN